jgi:hypothetical protein
MSGSDKNDPWGGLVPEPSKASHAKEYMRKVRDHRERQRKALAERKRHQRCKALLPYMTGNPMVVGGVREAHLACQKLHDHEGNHGAPDPAQPDKWREWPR